MAGSKQNIRSVLADIESFLVETLKSVKLSSSVKDQKDRLVERVRQVLDDIPGSAGSAFNTSNASSGSLKISGGGDSGSGGSSSVQAHDDDGSGYSDDIAKIAACNLKNKLQSGLLDRKKRTGFKSWEQCYCVISNNLFYIYKKQNDKQQKEAFCLSGYEFREAPELDKDASKKEMCFELIKIGAPSFQFRATSKDGMVIWREATTKGIQLVVASAADEPSESYEDVALQEDDSDSFPPPPPPNIEETDDIYEFCGEETPPSPPEPSQAVDTVDMPAPPPPEPEELYDDCISASATKEPEPVPSASRNKRRDPPRVPAPASEVPPPPPPKSNLPAIPKSLPPPLPVRRPSDSEALSSPPPPLPSNPPPLPGRSVRQPQLRSPFMDRDEDFENIYYGVWDCSADSPKELAFKQGDMIHVLSRDFEADNWWVGELQGRIGLVPKLFLSPAFALVS